MGQGAHSSPLGRLPGFESFAKAQRSPALSNLGAGNGRAGRGGASFGPGNRERPAPSSFHYPSSVLSSVFRGEHLAFLTHSPSTSSHSARFHPSIFSVIHSTNMSPRSTGEGTKTLRLESSIINEQQGRGEGDGRVGFPEEVPACSAGGWTCVWKPVPGRRWDAVWAAGGRARRGGHECWSRNGPRKP